MRRVCLIDVSDSAHSTTYLMSASASVLKIGLEPIIVTSSGNPGRSQLTGMVVDVKMKYGSRLVRLQNAVRLSLAVCSVDSHFAYHVTVTDHSLLGYGACRPRFWKNEYAHWMHGPTLDSGLNVVNSQYKKSFSFNWASEIGHFAPTSLGNLPVPTHKFPDVTNINLDHEHVDSADLRKPWSIGIVGNMSKYKGLLEFIRTAYKSSNSLTYLVAGNIPYWVYSEADKKTIADFLAKPNVTHVDGYINDGHALNSLLSRCRMIWVAYEKFPHSSNILVKCSHFGVPVIANDYGLIGSAVSEYNLGVFHRDTFDACFDCISKHESIGDSYANQNSQTALDRLFERLLIQ
jgi:glycosyltransferase involved in cell wall biosynthesis